MPNSRIDQLTQDTAPLLTDIFYAEHDPAGTPADRKVTRGDLLGVVTLGSDFPINAGAANALTDITGLSFAVTSGKTYYFEMFGVYTAGVTTTGSRWTVNGPTMTMLGYWSQYGLTATTVTTNAMLTAVQLPAAANATSNVSNGGANLVQIEGMFIPSANGTFQIQGAREVNTDTVTLKAGAMLKWLQTA